MAVVVTADLAKMVTVTDRVMVALRLTGRDAVNECALIITNDARRAVGAAIGAERRLSHVRTYKRGTAGKRSRVTAETIGKGGVRINPAYKEAKSTTNPVALIGARGPAHLIEHPRRGGYDVYPVRVAGAGAIPTVADMLAGTFGANRAQVEGRLKHPALNIAGQPRGHARPGPIVTPLAPITKAFRRAHIAVNRAARDAYEEGLRRRLGVQR